VDLQIGGAENGVVNVVNRLDESLFKTSVYVFKNGCAFEGRLRKGVRLVHVPKRKGNDLMAVLRLALLFRRDRPHIVHTHTWSTLVEGVLAAKIARVPILIHGEHGTLRKESRPHVYAQRMFWRCADIVLAVSGSLKQHLVREVGFPAERIIPIQNGVDTDRFRPNGERTAQREALGWPTSGIIVGSVGRLVSVKNHASLLIAAARVAQQVPQLTLALVGDGPLDGELKTLAQQLGIADRVLFLGCRDDVPNLLNAMDIFVLPSLREGMPNALLEAMACGLPVIASEVGGATEIVRDGENGLLVYPTDVERLSQHLYQLVLSPERRHAMGMAGRRYVEQEFKMEHMVNKYTNLYLALTERKFSQVMQPAW
jgi:sugar transferase (PEP-CTERM/EpsH1 system associated)